MNLEDLEVSVIHRTFFNHIWKISGPILIKISENRMKKNNVKDFEIGIIALGSENQSFPSCYQTSLAITIVKTALECYN